MIEAPCSRPVLVFGYGNLSRGDDALGPLLLEFVDAHFDSTHLIQTLLKYLTAFQFAVEHGPGYGK